MPDLAPPADAEEGAESAEACKRYSCFVQHTLCTELVPSFGDARGAVSQHCLSRRRILPCRSYVGACVTTAFLLYSQHAMLQV